MQKQDLSKIDFGKLTLPEWVGYRIAASVYAGRVSVSNSSRTEFAFKTENGWVLSSGARGRFFDELDQLRAICSQVDAFIAAELARLNEPDWVEVKQTETARLTSAGAKVKREGYVEVLTGYRSEKWFVDRKTLPDGVALYEPEWVEVSWTDADKLREAGATVEFQHDNGVWDTSEDARFATNIPYRADRSTLPAGYVLGVGFVEEEKAEAVKAKTLMEKVDELLKSRKVCTGSELLFLNATVKALIDVLEEERASM